MCGIFAYVGPRDATTVVLDGLARLEYRGYDSTGLAVVDGDGQLQVRKAAGKLSNLTRLVASQPLNGSRGVGHTRWATHGGPTDANAHPHTNANGTIVVVHNGIVENDQEIRQRLVAQGYRFRSATDSELLPHLIDSYVRQGLAFHEAVRMAAREIRGAHAIACLATTDPGCLVALRVGHAGGIAIGYGAGEMLIASDLPALVPYTRTVTTLAPNQIALVRPDGARAMDLDGAELPLTPRTIAANTDAVAKAEFPHFMLKEIMEQPEAAMHALRGRVSFNPESLTIDELPLTRRAARALRRVIFLGMGTSAHAAEVGARLTETIARLPASAENASEFRYRDPALDHRTLVVAVGQSGETADTLQAMHQAKLSGAQVFAVCNVEGSQATEIADGTLLMHAGPEIGVASSKTFTNSLVCLHLLAAWLGDLRGTLGPEGATRHVQALALLPSLLGRALELNREHYPALAQRYSRFGRFLFIGRGLLEPLAREGAMKLKEISYVHAEGMPAAELKHGPISLVDAHTPTVALALRDGLREKILANLSEVRARGGPILALVTEGDDGIAERADTVLQVPECPPLLAPIVVAPALQLLAYHVAVALDRDIDQPRNLAKSVTVE